MKHITNRAKTVGFERTQGFITQHTEPFTITSDACKTSQHGFLINFILPREKQLNIMQTSLETWEARLQIPCLCLVAGHFTDDWFDLKSYNAIANTEILQTLLKSRREREKGSGGGSSERHCIETENFPPMNVRNFDNNVGRAVLGIHFNM
jgi:hypothetical protein